MADANSQSSPVPDAAAGLMGQVQTVTHKFGQFHGLIVSSVLEHLPTVQGFSDFNLGLIRYAWDDLFPSIVADVKNGTKKYGSAAMTVAAAVAVGRDSDIVASDDRLREAWGTLGEGAIAIAPGKTLLDVPDSVRSFQEHPTLMGAAAVGANMVVFPVLDAAMFIAPEATPAKVALTTALKAGLEGTVAKAAEGGAAAVVKAAAETAGNAAVKDVGAVGEKFAATTKSPFDYNAGPIARARDAARQEASLDVEGLESTAGNSSFRPNKNNWEGASGRSGGSGKSPAKPNGAGGVGSMKGEPAPQPSRIHAAEHGPGTGIAKFPRANDPTWYKHAPTEGLTGVADALYAGKGNVTLSREAMDAFKDRVQNMDLSDIRHATFISLGKLLKIDELAQAMGDSALRRALYRDAVSITDGSAANQELFAVKSLRWYKDNVLGEQENLALTPEGGWLGSGMVGFLVNPVAKIFTRAKAGRNDLVGVAAGLKASVLPAIGITAATLGGVGSGFTLIAPPMSMIPGVASVIDVVKPLAWASVNWSDSNWLVSYWGTSSQYSSDRKKFRTELIQNTVNAGSDPDAIDKREQTERTRTLNDLKVEGAAATPVPVSPEAQQRMDKIRNLFHRPADSAPAGP